MKSGQICCEAVLHVLLLAEKDLPKNLKSSGHSLTFVNQFLFINELHDCF